MEFVDGETLAQRIERGPLPIEDALKLSRQIAEGIEAAHAKGVIHRDLKPSNIKITPEEKVKILDFGLAKGSCFGFSSAELSNSPTTSMAETIEGKILGTVAYMSPEQTRGQSLDKRSDIWSFGCVTYEMLTGRKRWNGSSGQYNIITRFRLLCRNPILQTCKRKRHFRK
jgi:serine/threonine protein kinase